MKLDFTEIVINLSHSPRAVEIKDKAQPRNTPCLIPIQADIE